MYQQKPAKNNDNLEQSNSVKPSYVRPTIELIRVDMDTHSKSNVTPKELGASTGPS